MAVAVELESLIAALEQGILYTAVALERLGFQNLGAGQLANRRIAHIEVGPVERCWLRPNRNSSLNTSMRA